MNSQDARFLETADRIGCRLCRDALWDGRRCNWLGWSVEPRGGTFARAYRAQSPLLYDGTAGIALFLSWLVYFTGDSIAKNTLYGALSQARQAFTDLSATFGFYGGLAGIASVFMHAGAILENEDLHNQGIQTVLTLSKLDPDSSRIDVTNGSAGTIPILLRLAGMLRNDELLASAKKHGEMLLRTASRSDLGWSWNTLGNPNAPHLLGYAHGQSGVACALLGLHKATGERSYYDAALEALRFERYHFNEELGNWPDLRDRHDDDRYSPVWCHGAAGIGFARLLAREAVPNDRHVTRELEIAASATQASLSRRLVSGQGFSLCHGVGGQCDLLLQAGEALGEMQWYLAAQEVGRWAIADFHDTDLPWPCGIPAGETPNLMLGLAGIGYFYLRLYLSEVVPSILILLPKTLVPDGKDDCIECEISP